MRKLMILIMVFLLPFFAFEMRADDKEQIKKIPIWKVDESLLHRDLVQTPITAYALISMNSICTCTNVGLGKIEIIVTNSSTGESWSNFFDSSIEPQSFLQISGTPGYYNVEYVTESNETYVGSFVIF